MIPGRSCPLHYRYGPEALAGPPALSADPLLVVGGLYGNPEALEGIEALATAENATVVFNGDFHWFDADPAVFETIQRGVLRHNATAGNVEAELASPGDGGCGCAYPATVDDDTVRRSNAIMERLQQMATPGQRGELAALAYHQTVDVAGYRVAILHGDPESLAGWGLAVDAEATTDPDTGPLSDWFRRSRADIFACAHTCLPHALRLEVDGHPRAVINNGSAGMPNFAGDLRGLITRIATTPSSDALYRVELPDLVVEALPVSIDTTRWLHTFLEVWPPASPARLSYLRRLSQGPDHHPVDAVGRGVTPA